MSWGTPSIPVAGTLIAVSWATTIVNDLLALRASPPNRAAAYYNNTLSVGSNSSQLVSLNTEIYDTASMHDTVTNNSRIVVPEAGSYIATAQALVGANYDVTGYVQIRKNGAVAKRGGTQGGGIAMVTMLGVSMAASDYFDMVCETPGSAVIFGGSDPTYACRLEVIGPLPYA